ncbi:Uncharacterized membrane protein HdeD, DUF308 family [Microbulbifer donghaiensis]|uniref:Uncharacterized membrane protein HdeD, DUF308 family n=1 Tax=Microbulbifer donghaiensis TaxID=494016 RepID=A0A1M5HCT4_9GAMM|nr:DUF308 domain-containing protein [Microbulbifer donghaiensis]SHG13612.1 Uncharacterized membrane protein HdeD, DUF308 family [Microbulbifer donghaiensis]
MRDAGFGGKSMTTLGILTIVLGALALMAPGIAGLSIAMVIGVLVLIAGVLRLIWAFRAGSIGKGIVGIVLGLLTIVAALILLSRPLLLSSTLTLLLAIYFIVDGAAEMLAGWRAKPETGKTWLILGGLVSILLGVILWTQFPFSGNWALGILFGVKLIFIGIIIVSGARPAGA